MNNVKLLCLAIVLLPLCAGVIVGLLGKVINNKGAHWMTTSAVGLSFFLSVLVLKVIYVEAPYSFNISIYAWAGTELPSFQMGFLIDRLSTLMMCVVSFVSWMVHIYTIGYMKEDPGYRRFFAYIALFTFGMLMLVMSNNFLQLFFGWEMVGLMSYLLIGFWYQRESAITANLKAFIVNRVGDFGFVLGIAAVFYYFGTLDYADIFTEVKRPVERSVSFLLPIFSSLGFKVNGMDLICLCLFMGAMAKSAQIPLHVWLPDSMEGPTPISALIHAATMVTAGVFMIARLSPLFEHSTLVLNVILLIGALTCLLTGLIGIVQNDIKRIIAYSTLSQLGYMMVAMGASAYAIGIFHLTTHAFFKALLFLGAGSVIVALHHEQDIWKMGNLKKYMPITYITLLIGSLALIGFPGFSGYYSKDLIINAVELSNLKAAPFAYAVAVSSVFITALYTFRLFFVVFHGKARMSRETQSQLHESRAALWIPLVLLAIPALGIGAFLVEPILHDYFKDSIVVHSQHAYSDHLRKEFTTVLDLTEQGFESIPFWLGMMGIIITYFCYVLLPNATNTLKKILFPLEYILKNQFGFDAFNQYVLTNGTKKLGAFFWKIGDNLLIDGVGVNGSAHSVVWVSGMVRKLQSGYLYHYAFVMIVGFLFLIGWLMLV